MEISKSSTLTEPMLANAMPVTPTVNPPAAIGPRVEDVEVEFDTLHGSLIRLVHALTWPVCFPFGVFVIVAIACGMDLASVGWVFMGFLILTLALAFSTFSSSQRKCTITTTQIVARKGRQHRIAKRFELRQVQEVTISQSFLERQFDLSTLVVHSGSSDPHAPRSQRERPVLCIQAIRNAPQLRELILARRDFCCCQQPQHQMVVAVQDATPDPQPAQCQPQCRV